MTLLASGFLIGKPILQVRMLPGFCIHVIGAKLQKAIAMHAGPSGFTVREIIRHSDANIKSWTDKCEDDITRPTRTFIIEVRPLLHKISVFYTRCCNQKCVAHTSQLFAADTPLLIYRGHRRAWPQLCSSCATPSLAIRTSARARTQGSACQMFRRFTASTSATNRHRAQSSPMQLA